jgi:hypothetical protein
LPFITAYVISSPITSTTWYKSTTVSIAWTTQASPSSFVVITLYSAASFTIAARISQNASNTGSYAYAVPLSLADGLYFITIQDVDNAVFTTPSLNFAIASGLHRYG